MDFLKKHYEKIVLTVALLVLIASAVYLAFKLEALNKPVDRERGAKASIAERLDPRSYTNALAALRMPPQWSNAPLDLFNTTPRGQVDEIAVPVHTNDVPRKPKLYLVGVDFKLFDLMFKSYSWEEEKKVGYNFQVNFRKFDRMFVVPNVGDIVKDRFNVTGYIIDKFVREFGKRLIPGVGEREVDVSKLTLKPLKGIGDPIELELNKVTHEKEPVATIRCGSEILSKGYKRDDTFDCGGSTYKVIDITPQKMIIKEIKDGELGQEKTITKTGEVD